MTTAADGYPLVDLMWTFVLFFGLLIYFWVLITVLTDVFRRRGVSGWAKAGWILLVLVVPMIGSLAYVIVHGRAMAERPAREHRAGAGGDDHVHTVVAPSISGVDEIVRGKELLDRGAITQDEFEQLKRRVLV